MTETGGSERRQIRWGFIASVALHVAVVALFLLRLPAPLPAPAEDRAVNVDLVPPPEETQKQPEQVQKQAKADEKKPELKAQEQAQAQADEKAAQPPEPPKPEEKPEQKQEQAAEPPKGQKPPEPPASPPQEEAKPSAPPAPKEAKPSEPPPQEQAKPSEPPPQQQEQAKAQEPPQQEERPPEDKQMDAEKQEPSKPLSPVMQRVVEFGDKDTGPKKSEDGDASQASVTSDQAPSANSDETEAAKAEPPKSGADEIKPVEQAAEINPVAPDISLPQINVEDVYTEKDGPASEGTDEAKTSFAPEKSTVKLKSGQSVAEADPKATTAPTDSDAAPLNKLKKAKSLFSRSETSNPIAKTMMDGVPRGMRFGILCASELSEQLKHDSPPHLNARVPNYGGDIAGTVLSISKGAFGDAHGWYNLSFRCEVDSGATKVVSFAFAVGNPIPRSEWRKHGITSD